jgi:hypothetical protein
MQKRLFLKMLQIFRDKNLTKNKNKLCRIITVVLYKYSFCGPDSEISKEELVTVTEFAIFICYQGQTRKSAVRDLVEAVALFAVKYLQKIRGDGLIDRLVTVLVDFPQRLIQLAS